MMKFRNPRQMQRVSVRIDAPKSRELAPVSQSHQTPTGTEARIRTQFERSERTRALAHHWPSYPYSALKYPHSARSPLAHLPSHPAPQTFYQIDLASFSRRNFTDVLPDISEVDEAGQFF